MDAYRALGIKKGSVMLDLRSAAPEVSAVIAQHAGGPERLRPHVAGQWGRAALAYWEHLCGGRRFPRHSDFNPMVLRAALPFVCLVEPVPGGRFRYRVVGSTLSEFLGGGNHTGRTVDEVFTANPEFAVAPYRQVCAEACLHMHTASAEWIYEDRAYLHYSFLLLPMGDSGTHVERILGVADFVPAEMARAR